MIRAPFFVLHVFCCEFRCSYHVELSQGQKVHLPDQARIGNEPAGGEGARYIILSRATDHQARIYELAQLHELPSGGHYSDSEDELGDDNEEAPTPKPAPKAKTSVGADGPSGKYKGEGKAKKSAPVEVSDDFFVDTTGNMGSFRCQFFFRIYI